MKNKPIFVIELNDEGQRLDNFLLRVVKKLNRDNLYKLIRKGFIRINGKRVKPLQKLLSGDLVRIPPDLFFKQQKKLNIEQSLKDKLMSLLLYEDESFLVINKPAGIACHAGTGITYGVAEVIQSVDGQQDYQLAHRLDKHTSGCLLFAKNRPSLLVFQSLLKEHKVKKHYVAVFEGVLEKSITVSQALDVSNRENGIRKVLVKPDGKSASSYFEPLIKAKCQTVVSCEIESGRTHQIRVHAAFIGHPVLGDLQYGATQQNPFAKQQKILLHAHKLGFLSESEISVEAAVPEFYRQLK